MDWESFRDFLGWCCVVNFCLLLLSTFGLFCCRSLVTRIHSKLFSLSEEALNKAYFQYLAIFKIAVIVFNLAPYLALRIML